MNNFKQLLIAIALVIGLSMTASAQRNDGKKTPPKEGNPPVIIPKDKPREDKPKDDGNKNNKGKKPEIFFLISLNRSDNSSD